MPDVRVGIVGAGVVANRHAGVLAGFADVTVRAIADPDLERLFDQVICGGTALEAPEHAQPYRANREVVPGLRRS
jgi:predicted dehydrogenase